MDHKKQHDYFGLPANLNDPLHSSLDSQCNPDAVKYCLYRHVKMQALHSRSIKQFYKLNE